MDIDRQTGALVFRADSLMQKRRSFIATPRAVVAAPAPLAPPAEPADPLATVETPPPRTQPVPPAPAADAVPAGSEDDLPVLTEIIPPEAMPAAMPAAAIEEALAHRLASELAQAVGERLEAELPTLIDASFARIENDLRHDLRALAESALKDFLARRQQLPAHVEPPAHD